MAQIETLSEQKVSNFETFTFSLSQSRVSFSVKPHLIEPPSPVKNIAQLPSLP
jgi:hypothetical protein